MLVDEGCILCVYTSTSCLQNLHVYRGPQKLDDLELIMANTHELLSCLKKMVKHYFLISFQRFMTMVVADYYFFNHAGVRSCHLGRLSLEWKIFGTPLVGRLSDLTNGSDIRKLFLKLLDPFLMPVGDDSDFSDEAGKIDNGDSIVEDVTSSRVSDNDAVSDSSEAGDEPHLSDDFQFYRLDSIRPTEIKMNEPLSISDFAKPLTIHVQWAEKMIEKYDTCLLSSLMEVCKPQLFTRMPPESVSLYKCLEAFLKEEPLGPEDMWLVCTTIL